MKRFYIKSLLAALILLCSTVASAYDFKVDGIYYNITDATAQTVKVTYSGPVWHWDYNEYIGRVVIPESVDYNGITYSVTSIGDDAFRGCSSLTSVVIPNSVTSIGNYAFYGCTRLSSVTIGDGVTSIGEYAFYECLGLTSITIPGSVTSIGDKAFSFCSGLTSIVVDGNNRHYDSREGCNAIIETATNTLIQGCQNTIIPGSVTSIGNSAFRGCEFTSVVIPNSVTSIGNYAFRDCIGLTSIEIPGSVTSIGSYAFYDCLCLTSVTSLATTAPALGSAVFYNTSPYVTLYYPTGSDYSSWAQYFSNTEEIDVPIYFCDYNGLPGSMQGNNHVWISRKISFSSATNGIRITVFATNSPDSYKGFPMVALGELEFYNANGEKIDYTAADVTTNSLESSEGSLEGLCDGDYSTFYHSTWRSGTTPSDYVYVDVRFAQPLDAVNIKIVGRNTGRLVPTHIGITSSGVYCPYQGTERSCGDNARWSLENGVLTISGTGAMWDYYSDWPLDEITHVIIEDGVTSIGDNAFYGCDGLTSVTIGDGVTSIGDNAFYGCSGLKTVYNCSSLNIVKGSTENGYVAYYADKVINYRDFVFEVEDGVNTLIKYLGDGGDIDLPENYNGDSYVIGAEAFSGCSGLTSIEIPGSVTSIGDNAFYDCDGLTSIEIPGSVTSIGESAFRYCSGLTSVTIGDGVTSIGDNAFYLCRGLTSIEIPGSVTSIGQYAFYECTGLTSVTIGDGVTSIGEDAFYGCSGLSSVTIGNSVTSIGKLAFKGCAGLTAVHISDLAAWCKINFSIVDSNPLCHAHNLYLNGKKVTDLVIPSGITDIKQCAFYGCSGLTSVTIGDGVTSIGDYAFDECPGLTSVTIGDGVTSIGDMAFSRCSGLTSVTIGDGVTSIGERAFAGCSGLTEVYVNAKIPPLIGVNAFNDYTATLYVPYGTKAAYQAAGNWNNFTNIVEMESEEEVIGGECGEKATWSLIDGVLTISGTGAMADYEANTTPWNEYRSYIISVVIEEGITSIGDCAFYDCTALTSVTIPNSVTGIGGWAFEGCAGLTAVHISDLAAWCNISFANYDSNPLYKAANLYLSGEKVTSLDIPWGVTSIKPYVFRDFFSLTSVTIPGSVTSIGEGSFRGCTELANVVIPNSVTSIGDDAFYDCYALASIKIGSGVTSIGYHAFQYCSGLTEIYVESPTPATINYDTFEGLYEQATLYVLAGAKAAYEAADYWKNFTNIVEMPVETGIDEIMSEQGTLAVYTLAGVKVMETTDANDVKSLPAGLYIINGKKVVVNK